MTAPAKPQRRRNAAICHRKAHSNTRLVGITDTYLTKRGKRLPRIVVSYRPRRNEHRTHSIYYGTNGRTKRAALEQAVEFRRAQIAARLAREPRIKP